MVVQTPLVARLRHCTYRQPVAVELPPETMRHSETVRQRDGQTARQKEKKKRRETERKRERQTERKTDREKERRSDGETWAEVILGECCRLCPCASSCGLVDAQPSRSHRDPDGGCVPKQSDRVACPSLDPIAVDLVTQGRFRSV